MSHQQALKKSLFHAGCSDKCKRHVYNTWNEKPTPAERKEFEQSLRLSHKERRLKYESIINN